MTDVVHLCAEFFLLGLCDQFTFYSRVFMTCIKFWYSVWRFDLRPRDESWYSVWRFDLRPRDESWYSVWRFDLRPRDESWYSVWRFDLRPRDESWYSVWRFDLRLCAEFVLSGLCDQFTFHSCVFTTCISLGTLCGVLIFVCDECYECVCVSNFDFRLYVCVVSV